eukprot:1798064-Rhodomonas_salina.2
MKSADDAERLSGARGGSSGAKTGCSGVLFTRLQRRWLLDDIDRNPKARANEAEATRSLRVMEGEVAKVVFHSCYVLRGPVLTSVILLQGQVGAGARNV